MDKRIDQNFALAVSAGQINLKVDWSREAKHELPNAVYSYFVGVALQEIIYARAGTGKLTFNLDGSISEYLFFSRMIGVYISKNGNFKAETNQAKIIYDKRGAHGWPTKGGIIKS